jgi:membrane protein YqaA with SNARE-associated domain
VHFLNRLNQYLVIMGIPGLLAISFLDSAAVPLPGGPDAVLLLLAWRQPAMTLFIVLTAALGSTLGCLVLYGIGYKGGEKALARFNPERVARIEQKMQEYGIWAIIVSVIAPPPFPTKLVILAAGVLRSGKTRVAAGVFIGRLVRYSLMGFLAARFGDQAAQVLKANYPIFSVMLIGGIVAVILFRYLKNRKKSVKA